MKTKQLHVRMTEEEERLLESIANSMNCSLSKAFINSMYLARGYLLKQKEWKPILTQKEINEQKEWEQKMINSIGVNTFEEVKDIINYNWLED